MGVPSELYVADTSWYSSGRIIVDLMENISQKKKIIVSKSLAELTSLENELNVALIEKCEQARGSRAKRDEDVPRYFKV